MKEIMKSDTMVLSKESRIILTGNHNLFIENYDKVLKFDSDIILLIAGKRKLLVTGKNLWMERYDKFDLQIKGTIYSIAYPGKDGNSI